MLPPTERRAAFTLVEMVVTICVAAILAGMIAPLAMKVVNQQREAKTREGLKAAFEGLFGAKDRRMANQLADFGFAPTASLANLAVMVAKPTSGNWSTVPAYAQDATTGLFWGYNGPYWNGPVSSGNPLDAWGRALRLKLTGASPNQTWQVYSVGANGVDETGGGDDLVYPTAPAMAPAYESVLNFNISNPNTRTISSVTAYWRQGTNALSATALGPYATSSIPTLIFNPWSGGTVVKIVVTGTGAATYYYLVDLLPGEVRDFMVTIP